MYIYIYTLHVVSIYVPYLCYYSYVLLIYDMLRITYIIYLTHVSYSYVLLVYVVHIYIYIYTYCEYVYV